MINAIFTGENKGEFFSCVISLPVIKSMFKRIFEGRDHDFNLVVQGLAPEKALVLNAMSWEDERCMKAWLNELETGGRFAVKHGDLEFGVAADGVNSAAAFANKEF